jgi:sigma-B regulation protein RsbU (phosphoserine phosphatase)
MTALFGSKKDDTPAPDSAEVDRLRSENQRLHRAVEELSVLNEIALAINSTMAPEQINKLIVSKCMRRLGVQQGTIHLFGDNESDPTKTLMRVVSSGDGLPMRISIQMQGWMHKNRKPLVINDLANDERFGGADAKNLAIKSLLCVPLELKGRLIGILNLFNKLDGDITPEDARLAAIIASQCSQVIETARLNAEEQKLHSLQEDLRNATSIQRLLLPRSAPQIAGADIAGVSHPAKDVGGDYFDYIDLGDGRWGIAVGDVSGKGMPAALLMANLQATMRGSAFNTSTVSECVSAVNKLLLGSTDAKTFVTLFYAIYDSVKQTLTYCNAGHNPPYLVDSKGEIRMLEVGGPLAAAFSWSNYSEETLPMGPGERLIIYTDGVTEAADTTDEQFGEDRLVGLIKKWNTAQSKAFIDQVVNEVLAFQKDMPVADDITLVCLRT